MVPTPSRKGLSSRVTAASTAEDAIMILKQKRAKLSKIVLSMRVCGSFVGVAEMLQARLYTGTNKGFEIQMSDNPEC